MVELKFFPDENSSICTFFKIFGLFPYSKNLCRQILFFLLSLIYIIIGPQCMVIVIFFVSESSEHSSKIDLTAEYFMLVGYIASQMISNGHALIMRRGQLKLLKMFNGIDYLIFRLDPNRDYTRERQRIFVKLGIISVISLAVPIAQIKFSSMSRAELISVSLFLPLLRLRCVQFIFFTDVIKIKLDILNELVKKINLRNPNAERTVVTSDFLNDLKSIEYILSQMSVMKTIYGKLWKTVEIINDCFGLSLLFIISHCFATLTVEAYWCYFSFFGSSPLTKAIGKIWLYIKTCNFCSKHDRLDALCIAIPDVLILIIMANSCSVCTDLVSILILIHQILSDFDVKLLAVWKHGVQYLQY